MNSNNKAISINHLKKDKLTSDFTPFVRNILRSFSIDDIEFIKGNILRFIQMFNNITHTKHEYFFKFNIERDEVTLEAIIETLFFIKREKNIEIYEHENLFKQIIKDCLLAFAVKNKDWTDKSNVEQIEFSETKALEILKKAEYQTQIDDRLNTIYDIKKITEPTGSNQRDEINKEISIVSFCATYNTFPTKVIFRFFMDLDIETYNKLLNVLQTVMFDYVEFKRSKIMSFNIQFPMIETRLVHGLKLYKHLFIDNKWDMQLEHVFPETIIEEQIRKSFKENHQRSDIPFTEDEISLAKKELKDLNTEIRNDSRERNNGKQ